VRRRQPKPVLQEALAHFEVVAKYGSGDLADQKTVDAICMRLPAGIEALSALSAADHEALFGDAWNQMWGMRTGLHTDTSWSSRQSCAAQSTETGR